MLKFQLGFIITLVLAIGIGLWLVQNPQIFKSQASVSRTISNGIAKDGQAFDPKNGAKCELGVENTTCMSFQTTLSSCNIFCCGTAKYDVNTGFVCSKSDRVQTPEAGGTGNGIFVSGFSRLKVEDVSYKAAQYRGYPKAKLSKDLVIPIFYINYNQSGYNSVASISNIDSVDTVIHIDFYSTSNDPETPTFKYSGDIPLKSHSSTELSLGSQEPFLRDFVSYALTNDKEYQRSMVVIHSSDAKVIGSVLTFSHSKHEIPDNSAEKTADSNSAINNQILYAKNVNKKSEMEKALRFDLAKPEDYFFDTLRPMEMTDRRLIMHQIIANVVNNGVNYAGGFVIANNSSENVNYKLNLIPRDSNGVLKTFINPYNIGNTVIINKPLRPFETRSFYMPILQRIANDPNFGPEYNAGIEVTSDQPNLFGFYYFTRINDQFGRGTAAFQADPVSELSECSTVFPVFNNQDYQGMNSMNSGMTVRNLGKSNSYQASLYPVDNPSNIRNFSVENGSLQTFLIYTPGDRTGRNYPKFFAAKMCDPGGALAMNSNTARNDSKLTFLNFGISGFPDSWEDQTYYVPYIMYRFDKSVAEGWVIPFNPNGDKESYKVSVYDDDGKVIEYIPHDLNGYSFENRIFQPKKDIMTGYIRVAVN